jgi:hypothetical protein
MPNGAVVAGGPAAQPEPSIGDTEPRQGSQSEPSARPGASTHPPAAPKAGEPAQRGPGLLLASIEGSIELRPAGGDKWRPAHSGDLLALGDRIRGAGAAKSSLVVGGAASLTIDARSQLLASDLEKLTFSLERGSVDVTSHGRAEVRVGTEFASAWGAGVRFRVRRGTGDEIRVSNYAGAVRVEAEGQVVTLAAMQETYVRSGEPPHPAGGVHRRR